MRIRLNLWNFGREEWETMEILMNDNNKGWNYSSNREEKEQKKEIRNMTRVTSAPPEKNVRKRSEI